MNATYELLANFHATCRVISDRTLTGNVHPGDLWTVTSKPIWARHAELLSKLCPSLRHHKTLWQVRARCWIQSATGLFACVCFYRSGYNRQVGNSGSSSLGRSSSQRIALNDMAQ